MDPYKDAAQKYMQRLATYRAAVVAWSLSTAANSVDRFGRDALLAHLRGKFRGVATQLTKRIGFAYTSDAARELIGGFDIDHAVVLCMVHDEIMELHTEVEIEMLLRQNVIGVKLTTKEHKELNKSYKQHMPEGWKWGDDPLARYKAIGLKVT
jgi:hypothetical protein